MVEIKVKTSEIDKVEEKIDGFLNELRQLGGTRFNEITKERNCCVDAIAGAIRFDVKYRSERANKNIVCRYGYDRQYNKIHKTNKDGDKKGVLLDITKF